MNWLDITTKCIYHAGIVNRQEGLNGKVRGVRLEEIKAVFVDYSRMLQSGRIEEGGPWQIRWEFACFIPIAGYFTWQEICFRRRGLRAGLRRKDNAFFLRK